jgi:hypothetical protein
MSPRTRKYLAGLAVIIGLVMLYQGIWFNITHIDDIAGAHSGAFQWPYLEIRIGAFILVLAPLVLRLYLWAVLQFLITVWYFFLR